MEPVLSKNVLLNKAPVGKGKIATFDLPINPAHVYGKLNKKDAFCAGQLMTSWDQQKCVPHISEERDYRKMNKMAIEKGIADAKGVNQFRRDVDVRKAFKRLDQAAPTTERIHVEIFGKKNRASTPIKGIMQGDYLAEANEKKAIQLAEQVSQFYL